MDAALYRLHADVEQRHWWFVARRQIVLSLLTELLPPGKGHLVIDVGCGTGANAAALAAHYRVLGVDASQDAITLASERYPAISFMVAQSPLEVPHVEQAGAFVLLDVLEHIEHDAPFLAAWVAAAAPGSWIIITVPADPNLWTGHDEAFGHYRRYTRKTLRQIWRQLPVETVMLSSFNSRLYPLIKMVRTVNKLRRKRGSDLGLPSPFTNGILRAVFATEVHRLRRTLAGEPGFSRGVSLIAVLRKC